MTNPSPPFKQVVEKATAGLVVFEDSVEPGPIVLSRGIMRPERAIVADVLTAALSTGLLKLVEEQPGFQEFNDSASATQQYMGEQPDPSSKPAPRTSKDLEQQDVEQPRGEPLDGAEAHELYSMFLANVDPAAFHPGHPLVTGAEKLAAMLDENHARFSEVLPDQPRGEPSEEVERELRRLARELRGTVSGPHAHFCQALGQRLANLADKLAIDNPSGEGPRCTCERGANLDHWSRCDVHRVERSYTAPLTPSDTEGEDGS